MSIALHQTNCYVKHKRLRLDASWIDEGHPKRPLSTGDPEVKRCFSDRLWETQEEAQVDQEDEDARKKSQAERRLRAKRIQHYFTPRVMQPLMESINGK